VVALESAFPNRWPSFDTMKPALASLPKFLAETKYAKITENSKTPFNKAFHTEPPGFIWFLSQPKLFEYFQRFIIV
jgi:demethylsterigmatocystin 6-O-methyltransferase